MGVVRKISSLEKRRAPPGATLEARENQMISLADSLAEKQLSEGTASAQVIVHYLKLGTTRERLEKEKLIQENEMLKAKTESLRESKVSIELYTNAIMAFKMYSGQVTAEDEDEEQ